MTVSKRAPDEVYKLAAAAIPLGGASRAYHLSQITKAVDAAAPSIRSQERQRIQEALKEQAAEYRREAHEADRRGEASGRARMLTAADVVDCVTEIISSPGAALDTLDPSGEQGEEQAIPDDYWREVPCGHPPDPVAMYNREGSPVCHCGHLLDTARLLPAPPEAPGPLSHCQKCGCHVAIPPATRLPATDQSDPSANYFCKTCRASAKRRGIDLELSSAPSKEVGGDGE